MTPATQSPPLPRQLICATTQQPITLVTQIACSGEGEVWRTDRDLLAKVYHAPDLSRTRKLEVMVAYPPVDPNAAMNHISFAWPRSLLQDQAGRVVGFLMPEIRQSVELLDVYHPQRRQKVLPGFNWLYLHTTAMNIASIIQAIHAKGYVLGDIKPQNILVNNQALPAVIDTDSFQVKDPETGVTFRCPVGSEGFTPPELIGKDLSLMEQTEVHDRFRLAIIIYLMLFGDHPFKGKWVGAGDSPDPNELLRQGLWPHAPNQLIQPSRITIPLKTLHPELQSCFLRCFNAGHSHPALRPTAREWVKALQTASLALQSCRKNQRHYYSQSYGHCYWCDRKASLGLDIFPPPPTFATALRKRTVGSLQAELKPIVERQIKPAIATWQRQFKPSAAAKPAAIRLPQSPLPPGQISAPQVPQINVNQGLVTVVQWIQQPLKLPRSLPQMTWPANWLRLTLVCAIVTGIFALLIALSQSKMDSQDDQLTMVGSILCLGLVGLCFAWLKVIKKYNL
jgi:DNA-binding helix-hairpin-helix protein with protein kinase domain